MALGVTNTNDLEPGCVCWVRAQQHNITAARGLSPSRAGESRPPSPQGFAAQTWVTDAPGPSQLCTDPAWQRRGGTRIPARSPAAPAPRREQRGVTPSREQETLPGAWQKQKENDFQAEM